MRAARARLPEPVLVEQVGSDHRSLLWGACIRVRMHSRLTPLSCTFAGGSALVALLLAPFSTAAVVLLMCTREVYIGLEILGTVSKPLAKADKAGDAAPQGKVTGDAGAGGGQAQAQAQGQAQARPWSRSCGERLWGWCRSDSLLSWAFWLLLCKPAWAAGYVVSGCLGHLVVMPYYFAVYTAASLRQLHDYGLDLCEHGAHAAAAAAAAAPADSGAVPSDGGAPPPPPATSLQRRLQVATLRGGGLDAYTHGQVLQQFQTEVGSTCRQQGAPFVTPRQAGRAVCHTARSACVVLSPRSH